ncbi:MAG TPA: NAD(P)H-dependent oxidoreductase [Candidatus Ruminococcus avistercoris]|nr:NAD(P)H-dependent oxidoreductase [Candidatus Ruminococcus avistercoris]
MDISEDEVDVEFLQTSDAVIFGSPVYFTSMSWELKRWFDNSFRIDLEGRWEPHLLQRSRLSGERILR